MNEPVHVTDAAFEKVVLKSNLPVVVDFWAPWCGPCRMVAPVLNKIAKEQAGKLVVAKVNTDENPEVGDQVRCARNTYHAVCLQWRSGSPTGWGSA